ncbi:MAG TPA: hypothetical protein VLA73_05640, partial [Burkholderiales bacterium]|nr:hypothetical protein [Burkholderiales bacterium]
GCGGTEGNRCRAGLFLLALQNALTGRHWTELDPLEREALTTLVHNAQTRWPLGLPVADPDLPNRDPLRFQRAIRESNVASDFDPLEQRAPLAIWSAAREPDMRQLIAGLAGFFTAADMRRLDHHLLSRALEGHAIRRTYRAPCEVRRKPLGSAGDRLIFDCQGEDTALFAVVYVKGGRATGTVERMKLEGAAELRDLELQSTAQNRFRVLARGLAARRADGNAIESLTLSVPESNSAGEARVEVIEDFPPLRAAVAEMARKDDALSAQPFRRAALLESLFARLGLEDASWCCLDDTNMSTAELEFIGEGAGNDSERRATEVEGFYRYCAVCHQSRERFPPGFLGGHPGQVSAALTRCAPRIYYRLRMWERERGRREKTPMPPAQALRAFGISTEAWRADEPFAELKRYADKRLPAGLDSDSIMQQPYESLPECAPAG